MPNSLPILFAARLPGGAWLVWRLLSWAAGRIEVTAGDVRGLVAALPALLRVARAAQRMSAYLEVVPETELDADEAELIAAVAALEATDD